MAIQGVPIESQERQAICEELIEFLSSGYGRTLVGAVQAVNSSAQRVSMREIYRWFEEDPQLKVDVDRARQVGLRNLADLAQNKMVQLVQDDKNPKEQGRNVRYLMERLDKPNFSTRTEITGKDGKPLNPAGDAPEVRGDAQAGLEAWRETVRATQDT